MIRLPRFAVKGVSTLRKSFQPLRFFTSHVNLTAPNGCTYDQPTGLFIGGEFVAAKSGRKITARDPSTKSDIVDVEEADVEDTNIAVWAKF